MWQTVTVLVILAAVLVYLTRHFLRVFSARDSGCGCCAGCQGPGAQQEPPGCDLQGEWKNRKC
ncbi:MAG: FeoB-associated Cys-rich membrane protein [Syntrophobacteraceae bacterium]|nr:FeoB-associated Cys-rich membrane protein [Syntrophobacteraceae bacterium]NTV41885.1 FeoB-associated Cys-rich membrane protein [Syntrophobacteraceae bacterium]